MTSVQKTAVSFLFTVALFAAFALVAFGGLFTTIDVSFYQPVKTVQLRKQLDTISDSFDTYFTSLASGFADYAADPKIMTYLERRVTIEDMQARSNFTASLFAATPGLEGIRIIDRDGESVHFSTYDNDVLKQTKDSKTYKKYTALKTPAGEKEIPTPTILVTDSMVGTRHPYAIYFDQSNLRIIVSLPFVDKYALFRGTIVFYMRSSELRSVLAKETIAAVDEHYTLMASTSHDTQGIVFGMPVLGQEQIISAIQQYYAAGSVGPDTIVSDTAIPQTYIVLSTDLHDFFRVSGIYPSSLFMMSKTVRYLLLVCVFISLFLGMFLLFNLQYDDVSYIRDYIKKLQFTLLKEYNKRNHTEGWNTIADVLSQKKEGVSKHIIKKVGRHNKKKRAELAQVLNQSWTELIDAIKAQEQSTKGISEGINQEQLRAMLQDVLAKTAISVVTPNVSSASKKAESRPVVEQHDHDTARVAEANIIEAEAEKQLSTVEAVEPVEDLEELDDVEEIEDVAPAEKVEDLEEVEELDEVEPLEEATPAEELESVDEVEAAEAVEDLEEVEELDEVEPLEESTPAEELESVDEVEAAEAVEDLEEVEELDEVEPLEEVAPTKELESVDEVETPEGVEDLEEVEELDEAEPANEVTPVAEVIEEVQPTHPIEPVKPIVTEPPAVHHFVAKKSVEFVAQSAEKIKEAKNTEERTHLSMDTSDTKTQKIVSTQHINDSDIAEPLELLENTDNKEFSFTAMKMKNTVITELHPINGANQAIVTSPDGIISISNTVDTSRVHIDKDFKDLVDSVLK